MSNFSKVIFLACMLCWQTGICAAQSSSGNSGLMVIVFKDGHQQSFALSEVSRLEFNPARIVLKNGRQEDLSANDIVRIEMNNPSAGSGVLGRDHFLGKWKVGTGAGTSFIITLEPNGQAKKSIGASHGTWEVVNGEARIKWDDGWHDAIRKVGSKHEKFAYQPGKSFDDEPSNVTEAQTLNPEPI
jgi:hypothetical protein